ncbi:AAEL001633-PA [Aedes aegypti]|uniref:AAEL001633-PA n=1 Tax=Aedes aegypti TaxID=7159 RepID=Q17KJ3_AEDAE|nr:AAEL001633-PA [Aedes aegypti]
MRKRASLDRVTRHLMRTIAPQQEYTLVWNSPVETRPIQQNTETALPIKVEVVGYVNTVQPAIQEPKPVTEQPKPRQKRKIKKVNVFTSQWYCEPCGRAFKSKGGLVQHNQQIHSGPTPHGCNICGKKFRDIDTMEQHRQRHLMKDKPFKCSECPKQFIRQSDLQRHIGLHHSVSPHQCDLCGRVFDRADHLTDHGLSHVNGTVKKYKGRGLA